jgi:hypothetical protein
MWIASHACKVALAKLHHRLSSQPESVCALIPASLRERTQRLVELPVQSCSLPASSLSALSKSAPCRVEWNTQRVYEGITKVMHSFVMH